MKSAPKCQSHRLLWWTLVPAGLALGAVVLLFAVLREQPDFWLNAGGYPVWLREVVREGFYPLLVAGFGVLAALGVLFMREPAHGPLRLVQIVVLGALWMLLLGGASVAFGNNVLNLIEHRAVHSHARR
jgi:hypothetical protein